MKRLLFILLLLSQVASAQMRPVTAVLIGYDSNATAFNNSASLSTQLHRTAITTTTKGLKNAGLFTLFDGLYPMIGGTSSTHVVNLRTVGTYTLTMVGSPTHGSNGVDFNGSTQYINTNIPLTRIGQSAAHFGVYFQEDVSGGQLSVAYGNDDGTNHFGTFVNYANQFYNDIYNEAQGRLQVATAYDARAYWGADLNASLSHTAYRNGSSIGSRTNTSATAFTGGGTILINARNTNPDFSGTKAISWFDFAPVGLSAAQESALYTVIQALQTTLGRNQ